MKLIELIKNITPLPWKKRSGDPAKENEVCYVRGVTIFGPRRAVACDNDAKYIEHSANVLPELVTSAREFLDMLETTGGTSAKRISRLECALAVAEEVKDNSEQLTPEGKPQTVTMP